MLICRPLAGPSTPTPYTFYRHHHSPDHHRTSTEPTTIDLTFSPTSFTLEEQAPVPQLETQPNTNFLVTPLCRVQATSADIQFTPSRNMARVTASGMAARAVDIMAHVSNNFNNTRETYENAAASATHAGDMKQGKGRLSSSLHEMPDSEDHELITTPIAAEFGIQVR